MYMDSRSMTMMAFKGCRDKTVIIVNAAVSVWHLYGKGETWLPSHIVSNNKFQIDGDLSVKGKIVRLLEDKDKNTMKNIGEGTLLSNRTQKSTSRNGKD